MKKNRNAKSLLWVALVLLVMLSVCAFTMKSEEKGLNFIVGRKGYERMELGYYNSPLPKNPQPLMYMGNRRLARNQQKSIREEFDDVREVLGEGFYMKEFEWFEDLSTTRISGTGFRFFLNSNLVNDKHGLVVTSILPYVELGGYVTSTPALKTAIWEKYEDAKSKKLLNELDELERELDKLDSSISLDFGFYVNFVPLFWEESPTIKMAGAPFVNITRYGSEKWDIQMGIRFELVGNIDLAVLSQLSES